VSPDSDSNVAVRVGAMVRDVNADGTNAWVDKGAMRHRAGTIVATSFIGDNWIELENM